MAGIRILTARAGATVLREIGADFERETGHRIDMSLGVGPAFVARIKGGEHFDIVISSSSTIDGLIQDGRISADTRKNVFRSGMGVGVRSGAPRPDIGSVDALKAALRDAGSIGYLRVNQVDRLIQKLGLTEDLKSKVQSFEEDLVSEYVASGKLDLGIVVATQILTTPGVDLVGPLPPEIQYFFQFVAGVSAKAACPAAASDLIELLLSSAAVPVIRAQGMEPG